MDYLVFFGTAFIFCSLLTSSLVVVARKLDLVDLPTKRKRHSDPTPLVGGVAIYITVCFSALSFATPIINVYLLVWLGLVLALGVVDDLIEVPFQIRLLCQICIVIGIYMTVDLAIYDIGSIVSSASVNLAGAVALIFTAIAVVGTANAVNMSDGADGLAASLIIASLIVVFYYANSAEVGRHHISPAGIMVFAGALSAFFFFNCRFFGNKRAIAFLGDAGSTTLGFLLALSLIHI